MARIGLCEDDPKISRVVQEALRSAGHDVVAAFRGSEALGMFVGDPELAAIILDVGLPDSDGRDVCQALRAAGVGAPVLFLTARGGVHEIVSGFGAGGNDYLVKPFAIAELQARVTALTRRLPQHDRTDALLHLDPERFSLRSPSAEVGLTPTEFRLLAALLGRPGEVLRRRELVAAAWPHGAMVQQNTLDSYIRRLRRRLTEVGATARIETVRGVGFSVR